MLQRFKQFAVTVALATVLCILYTSVVTRVRPEKVIVARHFYSSGEILQELRDFTADEMRDYTFPNGRFNVSASKLSDLLLEEGGTPLRSIVLSSWRSGSTFLGELLSMHPAVFYDYEPFWHRLSRRIRGPPESELALTALKEMLHCIYRENSAFMNYVKNERHEILDHNTRISRWSHQPNLHSFLSAACRTFPFHLTKITRLRLALTRQLLEDPTLNVRIVLLVRDPRATFLSRSELPTPWCADDCANVSSHCADLVDDHASAQGFLKLFPDRFAVVRYEELALDPVAVASRILNFFGMDAHENVLEYLRRHSQVDDKDRDPYGTDRNSSDAAFRWTRSLPYEKVKHIQQVCAEAMKLWGYLPARDAFELLSFTPLEDVRFF